MLGYIFVTLRLRFMIFEDSLGFNIGANFLYLCKCLAQHIFVKANEKQLFYFHCFVTEVLSNSLFAKSHARLC